MYVVLQYTYDLEDSSTDFQQVVFVTKDIEVAEKYKSDNDNEYLGHDCWQKVVIKQVAER